MGKETAKESNGSADDRGNWTNGTEFLLSCISISIGLGNIWRFPNLAYENGGGAFLIPYFVVVFLVSKPLYYMELAFGQFTSKGPSRSWSCVPGFKGIGMAQMVSTYFLTVFINYIMAISLFYIFASLRADLPWKWCDPEWANNETCYTRGISSEDGNWNITNSSTSNATTISRDGRYLSSAPEQYFNNYVIKDSGSLEAISSIDWRMVLCLLLSWVIVAVSTLKGIKSVGKVVYVTASYPYVVLIALLILALTMDGATDGIKYFFIPEWKDLYDVKVWYKACEQSFFSLNTGFGHLIMYASYNNFRHNIHRDAMIITVADTLTSVLAGCVVFAILGTLAFDLKTDVKDVVKDSGLRLAFVVYPEALARIKFIPQLWSILFFVMLYMLGLGSAVGHVEAIATTLKDEFSTLRSRKALISLGICFLCFLGGLPLTTDAGQYIMPLIDGYGVGAAVFLYAIFELVGVMWIYGWRRFCDDIHFMLGSSVQLIWKVTWAFVGPVALIVIYLYGTITMIVEGTATPKGVPEWGLAVGWVLSGICIIQLPLWYIVVVFKSPETTWKRKLLSSLRPSPDWGPSDPKDHSEWLLWKKQQSGDCGAAISLQAYQNQTFEP